MAWRGCRPLGVASTTHVGVAAGQQRVERREARARRCAATAAASAAGSVSHTATSSARSAWLAQRLDVVGCAMRPQPTRAKRSLRSVMGGGGRAWMAVAAGAGKRELSPTPTCTGRARRAHECLKSRLTCNAVADDHQAPADAAAPRADDNQLIAERREKLAAHPRRQGVRLPERLQAHAPRRRPARTHGELPNEELEPQAVHGGGGRPHDAQARDGQGLLRHAAGRHRAASSSTSRTTPSGAEALAAFKHWDLGDILGGEGTLFRTKTGELSVQGHHACAC